MPQPNDVIDRLNAALGGRYRIERELGAGGMATVYLADDLRHSRKVALKVLKPELAAVVGAERFLAEIKTTANLQHPHILPLFDSGEADSFLFYVMPYVEGETLRDRLEREHQLPVEEAVTIATKVAGALQAAHDHGVIHRDIKPANILLSKGEPLVSDFGIALAVGAAGGGRLTETGLSLGTPHYMSPEQAVGDHAVGAPSDVYALACVLYEMLAGDPPFMGSTAQAILGRIVTGDSDPVTKHRRQVPPNVDAAIRRALERVPADRFRSATEFSQALTQPTFRYGETTAAGGSAAAGPWKSVAIVLGVLLAASLTGLGWSARRPEAPALVGRFSAPFTPEQTPTGPMEFTPDGSTIVYVGPAPNGGQQIWVRRLDETEAAPIPGTSAASETYLEVSPDGRDVAFVAGPSNEGPLMVVPLQGGPARQLAPVAWGAHGWTRDGTIYYQNGEDQAIWRVSTTGAGVPEKVTEMREGEGAHDALRLLPGERQAVFTAYTDGATGVVWLLDLESGERTRLTEGIAPRYLPTGHLLWVRSADGMLMGATLDEDGELGTAVALLGPIHRPSGVAGYAVSSAGWLVHTADRSDGNLLVWVDREGREEPLPLEPQEYAYPSVSPDGGRAAVTVVDFPADLDIWVFDLGRFSRTRITFGGDNRYVPIWSPTGTSVTASTGVVSGNWVRNIAADGSGRMDSIFTGEGMQFATSWSRDGRFLAMTQSPRPGGSQDISLLELGGEAEVLLATPFAERAPQISPNGQWLTYESDKSGREEIYLRPLRTPGAEVVISTNGGIEARWSPSGNEVFYRGEGQMMAVDMSDPGNPGQPRALWEDEYLLDTSLGKTPNYGIHPDGQRFLMVRAAEGTAATEVVVNWVEELRQRVQN